MTAYDLQYLRRVDATIKLLYRGKRDSRFDRCGVTVTPWRCIPSECNFRLEIVMSPNPTALRSLVKQEDVDEHRSVSCAEYDQCLDEALRRSWRSWSCARCKLFRITRELHAAEGAQIAVLRSLA